jgi:hypothetical protein
MMSPIDVKGRRSCAYSYPMERSCASYYSTMATTAISWSGILVTALVPASGSGDPMLDKVRSPSYNTSLELDCGFLVALDGELSRCSPHSMRGALRIRTNLLNGFPTGLGVREDGLLVRRLHKQPLRPRGSWVVLFDIPEVAESAVAEKLDPRAPIRIPFPHHRVKIKCSRCCPCAFSLLLPWRWPAPSGPSKTTPVP